MMDTKQPEALRIADDLRHSIAHYGAEDAFTFSAYEAEQCVRALHAENESLRTGYAAARLEIASLQAQLEAIGAGGVEPLRKRCLHRISEPARPVFGLPGTRDIDVAAAQRVWDAARGAALAAPAQAVASEHLFELWWAEYMPEAVQAQAWKAWRAATAATAAPRETD